MKKLSFLLAVILLLAACFMTACKKDDETEENPTETTTAPEQNNPVVHASISTEQLANYTIISAKSTSSDVDKAAEQLRLRMQDVFEVLMDSKTGNAYNKTQYEILIGNTDREETATFVADMKWDDYGYGIVGDKLVIAGKNEDGTFKALRAFLDYVSKHEGGDIFFSNANCFVASKQYPFDNISINSMSADKLSIVCNTQGFGGMAESIRGAIIKACGIAVPIITDADVKEGNQLIVIGESEHISQELLTAWNSANVSGSDYYFGTDANTLWINANTAAGFWNATAKITQKTSGKDADNVVLSNGVYDGEDAIAVMSFNLKAEDSQVAYNARIDDIVNTILKYRPAVIGVQEATDMWIGLLEKRLEGIYTIKGDGRSATKGDEHSAILYLTEEFNLIKTETKWLSETPDVPGSQHSTAISTYPRIMTYAVLERKSDGKQFIHVNTHLDYGSSDAEEQVKVNQMQVIFDEIAKLNLDVPTIITGDFNATVGSPVYDKVIEQGYSEAASHIPAPDREPTYHALMGTTGEPSHIDFIFSKGLANDNLYRICTERQDNENVSDHYPILAILSFQTED